MEFLALLIVIFLAIGIHEYAHCKIADASGDPTPRIYGRVTLNLFKHLDPLGSMMIVFTSLTGFGIGWGKPAPIDPRKMKNPRWDLFATVAAGPISNLLQAAAYALVLRITDLPTGSPPFLQYLLYYGVLVNLSLCFFNLIPLGVLDGHWLVGTFLPERIRTKWYMWNRQHGFMILLLLVIGGQLLHIPVIGMIIGRPTEATFAFLTGRPI